MKSRAAAYGIAGFAALLGLYFVILTLVSGWPFAREQFQSYWYFVVPLAVGFGVQLGLYSYLRQSVMSHGSRVGGRAVAVTGTTSTAAMISCCAHYLVNILPVLGAVGVVTFIAQYQTELFWVGIIFNFSGIAYIGRKVVKFRGQMA